MEIENLFKKWEKYLTGKVDCQPGQGLKSHSVMVNIQLMVDDDFIFRTFNDAGFEMSKNKDNYEKHFCSNEYLIRALTKWYQETQSLYVRRLTEDSGKRWKGTFSLKNLLTDIEKNLCHVNRKSFYNFHKKDEVYTNSIFDILSEKNMNQKDSDKISENYLKGLKAKLATAEIAEVRDYTDKVVAHSDFEKFEGSLSIDKIKKCHESIIEVYREIERNFFLRGSSFGETALRKELVLQNTDKPFFTKQINKCPYKYPIMSIL